MKCKFCNSDKIKVLRKIKSPHNDMMYSFYKCNHCDSHFFDLKEHKFNLEELYNKLADNASYSELFKKLPNWENQVKIIKSLNNNISNILDVGCRTGDFLMHWETNIKKSGIELSKKSANIAKKRGLDIYEDFIENISFDDRKFDVVTCYAVLEHLESPITVLDGLTEIVNDDGILVILVPYFDSFKSRILYLINYRWHMFSQPEHLNFYSKKFLDHYIEKKGFHLEKAIYTSGGMFNPFKKIPILGVVFGRIMNIIDFHTPLNKLPIFDHMYLYYKKQNEKTIY